MKDAMMARELQKFYRLAFYGVSGAGKTCYLGMLALSAESQGGLSCEYLPVQVPIPKAAQGVPNKKLTETEREALGLHEGRKWLEEHVIHRLEDGELPDANPPTFDGIPPTFDFRLGHPSRGPSAIRLIDYSGELINPTLEDDPTSFVRKLREFLTRSDGFLVFAEVPHRNTPAGAFPHPSFRRLREAFASLQESRGDVITTPVCVVLTKWDRWSSIDRERPHEELKKLREFLADHPEYEGLVTAISNAVAAQPVALADDNGKLPLPSQIDLAGSSGDAGARVDRLLPSDEESSPPAEMLPSSPIRSWGLRFGNTQVFPVSSFGATRLANGKELPVGRPQPFGLLQPLAWLVECRDALDVAALEKRSQSRGWVWLPFAFLLERSLRRDLARLRHRIPSHTDCGQRLALLRRKSRRDSLLSILFTFAVFLVLAVTGMGGYLSYQFRTYARVVEAPEAGTEQLIQAKDFFESFIVRKWLNGPFVPSPAAAQEYVERLNQRLEEPMWRAVEAASDPVNKGEAASTYLQSLPNGKYAAEARVISQQGRAEKARREGEEKNRQWFAKAEQNLAQSQSTQQFDDLIARWNQGLPAPEYATAAQKAAWQTLIGKAQQRRGELIWNEFMTQYHGALSQGQLQDAATMLARYTPHSPEWKKLVREFPGEVHKTLENPLSTHLRDYNFSDARRLVARGADALKQLEASLRPTDPTLAEEILNGQREVGNSRRMVDECEDGYLYEQVRTHKDKPACITYVNHAPLKIMESWVSKYQQYLERLDEELAVAVALRIAWDENYQPDSSGPGENRVSLMVDGIRVLQSGSVIEDRGKLSGELGVFTLNGKRGTQHQIEVSILEYDVFQNDDGGSGRATLSLEALARKENRIPLRSSEGGFTNYAVLNLVEGWPQEPPLPPWSKDE